MGHSPVFLAASSMFAISGQSTTFQVLKEGTHGDTYESRADGRLKSGVFCANHLTRKAAAGEGMCAASTAFCPRMSKLCPYPHRLLVLTDSGGKGGSSRFHTPQFGSPLPSSTRPWNSTEKRTGCYPVFDSVDIRWRCDRS